MCFDHIHLDIVGPLPLSQGYRNLLTCVDRYTRWPEAIPIPDSTAETVAHVCIAPWNAVFGVPLPQPPIEVHNLKHPFLQLLHTYLESNAFTISLLCQWHG